VPMKQSIRRSVLWAAYGDALGFITEMCNESRLLRRTRGKSRVTELIPWFRKIGGEFGIYVELPMGCYSDDTQLRLATSRSIRGDGSFDVETFSKIEIPVWLSYALGAGVSTKLAAQSLKKSQVQWNSNFFKSKYALYTDSGGNGAAMRIQPHVWCAPQDKGETGVLRDVIRNTVTTHGHARALIGAAFHALVLHKAILTTSVPGPSQWSYILDNLMWIPKLIQSDEELTMYWLPNWEKETKQKIEKAIEQSVEELRTDVIIAEKYLQRQTNNRSSYAQLAGRIGCLRRESAGSAPKTALLATYLSFIFQDKPHDGLVEAVNLLGSDTDTIATMAGAIMGTVSSTDPPEKVADVEYLENEANRLYELSQGNKVSTYNYPDMLYWRPPVSQIDALGQHEGKWVLQGLGEAIPTGVPIEKRNKNLIIWQWFRLNSGQTVLLSRRPKVITVAEESLPIKPVTTGVVASYKQGTNLAQKRDTRKYAYQQSGLWDKLKSADVNKKQEMTIDSAAAIAIKSRLKSSTVGSLLLQLSEQEDGTNKAIAFAEVIAKAKRARMKQKKLG